MIYTADRLFTWQKRIAKFSRWRRDGSGKYLSRKMSAETPFGHQSFIDSGIRTFAKYPLCGIRIPIIDTICAFLSLRFVANNNCPAIGFCRKREKERVIKSRFVIIPQIAFHRHICCHIERKGEVNGREDRTQLCRSVSRLQEEKPELEEQNRMDVIGTWWKLQNTCRCSLLFIDKKKNHLELNYCSNYNWTKQ